MALRPGQMLSHYLLIEKIGEGGMGVVWKADDKVLHRPVAIKVLRAHSAVDDARRGTFLREARLASSVRHAHVVQIHEFGREGDVEFIVMELVEGRSLSQILHGRPLPPRQVAEYGHQAAEALAHAHRTGLLHRDLKPGNLLLTADDEVKVADFGLATLLDRLEPSVAADASTKTLPEHTERKIAGTLPYMSPEQVRGERLDSRSDIFSLGVILYEMTAGQRPFQGTTGTELAAEILRARPRPVHDVFARVPFDLDRAIHKALAARPSERYQTMDDLAVDLRRLTRDLDSGSSPSYSDLTPPAQSRRRWATVAAAVGAVALVAIATALYLRPVTRRAPTSPPVHRQLTFTGHASAPEIAPDGQFVAHVEGGSVRVQDLAGSEPVEVRRAERIGDVRWSPTGTELLVAVFDGHGWGLDLVPRLGGAARRLDGHTTIAWSPDGTRYASSALMLKYIRLYDLKTGEFTVLSLEDAFQWLYEIDWSPTGDRLAFRTHDRDGRSAVWTIPVIGGRQAKVVDDASQISTARWNGDGTSIYYLSHGHDLPELRRVAIDPQTGEPASDPTTVLTGLALSSFSFCARTRTLAYTQTAARANLWTVSVSGTGPDPRLDPRRITSGTADESWVRVSPDSRQLVFVRSGDLYTMSVDGGAARRLTFTDGREWSPAWSPDGTKIAFGSNEGGTAKVWTIPASGGTARAFDGTRPARQLSWAPGDKILYLKPGHRNFSILDPRTGAESPLIANESVGYAFSAQWSRDGKRVAVNWNRWRGPGVWTISVEDRSEKLLCSARVNPIAWSAKDEWIYARQDRDIVRIPAGGGEPETVFRWPVDEEKYGDCSPFPDGTRWLCSVGENSSDVWVAENFDAER